MAISKGELVLVHTAYAEYAIEDGYLVLEPGMELVVEFVGKHGEELGWLFGFDLTNPRLRGWFPQAYVKASSPAPVSSAPKPAHEQMLQWSHQGVQQDHDQKHQQHLQHQQYDEYWQYQQPKQEQQYQQHQEYSQDQRWHQSQQYSDRQQFSQQQNRQHADNGQYRGNKLTTHIPRDHQPSQFESNPQPHASQGGHEPQHNAVQQPLERQQLSWQPSLRHKQQALHQHDGSHRQQQARCEGDQMQEEGHQMQQQQQHQQQQRQSETCDFSISADVRHPAPPSDRHSSAQSMPPLPPATPLSRQEPPPPKTAPPPPLPPPPGRPPPWAAKPVKRRQPGKEERPSSTEALGDPITIQPPPPGPPAPQVKVQQQQKEQHETMSSAYGLGDGGMDLPPPGFDWEPANCDARRVEVRRAEEVGSSLPLAPYKGKMLELVERHRVIVVDAATGSGKSTMVPVYLCGQCLELNRACRIVVTQPRRLAARGLAERVAAQSGSRCGDFAGYRVGQSRQDRHAPIVYVTAGHLLEALVHNPRHLDSFSHIVLDEVHERFMEADFLMTLLRLSLSRPRTLAVRIVVMSATLQQTLQRFFRPLLLPAPDQALPGHVSLPGATPYEVSEFTWEEAQVRWPRIMKHIPGKRSTPNFADLRPSQAKLYPVRRRSEHLTRLCKEMAPFCARLLKELHLSGYSIALVFLPGLDQMREVEELLKEESEALRRSVKLEVFLMHSALDEEWYKGALQPADPGTWRVVLATNIAESSLTCPGVNAVIDFGMHRVNVYDDEMRMSHLATEWCSKASMKQRRGRTGRTNAGCYVQLIGQEVRDELVDFDDSDVERAPLARVTLQAAHLAELLNKEGAVSAGLPVRIPSGIDGFVDCWHGSGDGWRMADKHLEGEDFSGIFTESDLTPLHVDSRCVLGLLPAPPREDRVQAALNELHELGALTSRDTPSVMGAACLKLPLDVQLGRLVVLGWCLGCAADAAALAAALSLAPACDVLRTPFNTQQVLDARELDLLKRCVELRRRKDAGSFSEPLTVHGLFVDWIRSGGGLDKRGGLKVPWKDLLHLRLWAQFSDKVVDIVQGLLHLLPMNAPEAQDLQKLLQCMRGLIPGGYRDFQPAPHRHLAALLTWSLTPAGFVAVGQTPALYDDGGSFATFARVVRKNSGSMAGCLYWPQGAKALEATVKDVAKIPELELQGQVRWVTTHNDITYVGFFYAGEQEMSQAEELMYRICGPFNGKETYLLGARNTYKQFKPARHPCTHNWYMPRRDNSGNLMEVRVGWKTQADTLLHVPQKGDRTTRCRPKRFMVASGGEYHSSSGRRNVHLRGTTVLPAEDGGRSALLWLLSAGIPFDAKFVALAAPSRNFAPGDFEVRALRLWQRTFWLPRSSPLTSADFRVVNAFRNSLLDLQHRRPHRLAGEWQVHSTAEVRRIECLDSAAQNPSGDPSETSEDYDVLIVSGGPHNLTLVGRSDGIHWRLQGAVEASSCMEVDGCLQWSDGSMWRQHGREDCQPILSMFGTAVCGELRRVARNLMDITDADAAEGSSGRQWPARLVPMRTMPSSLPGRSNFLDPFDLDAVDAQLAAFSRRLVQSDLESSSEEDNEADDAGELDGASDEEDGEEACVDVSQERINEEYMWRCAEEPSWGANESRQMVFVESAIALPVAPFCVDCEMEGKSFSKSQLMKHPDERRCRECVIKAAEANFRRGYNLGDKKTAPPTKAASQTEPNFARCVGCNERLTNENCSASQRQKKPNYRRCKSCQEKEGFIKGASAGQNEAADSPTS